MRTNATNTEPAKLYGFQARQPYNPREARWSNAAQAVCAAAVTLGKARPRKTLRDLPFAITGRLPMLLYEFFPGFYTGSSDPRATDSFIGASQQHNSR